MNIVVGDLLTIEGEKYITLEMVNYNGNEYAFVNKMTEAEEATDEFYIFEILDDSISIVTDDSLKDILILKFQDLLQKDIVKIMQE